MPRVRGTYRKEDGSTFTKTVFVMEGGTCPAQAIDRGGDIGSLVTGTCVVLEETTTGCFIATAAYGSELAPPVQFLRNFRDDVVLKSKFKKQFNAVLNVYYKFSPTIANQMRKNKPLKYTMKYTLVWPFVAISMLCAYFIKIIIPKTKKQ